MPVADMRFIKRCAEFISKEERGHIQRNTRGLYVLFDQTNQAFNVVYIGMARGQNRGIRSRINSHAKSRRKGTHWSHFSLFEVHDNVSEQEIEELEGLFRHIYRKDSQANLLNRQKRYKKLYHVRNDNLDQW